MRAFPDPPSPPFACGGDESVADPVMLGEGDTDLVPVPDPVGDGEGDVLVGDTEGPVDVGGVVEEPLRTTLTVPVMFECTLQR
jgi:hypothetical protein